MRLRTLFVLMLFAQLCWVPALSAAPATDDGRALAGLKTARVIFDVRVAELDKLVANLALFAETLDGITAQGVKTEMVVAFRGPGVRLLTAAALSDEAREALRSLSKRGVRFEACAVAMRIFKADPGDLVPEVTLVANVFHSLIGYQNKGYAMIAIN
ncbi:MAG: hypothetical protein BWK76_24640 [Desulfobulbaceae bacterium A2]|nr:MAG: hypothetical protein BWK76_24640 [Desulfobulbaceae bacterium A2]